MSQITRITAIGATTIIVAGALSMIAYPHLPEVVPTHWDINGEANRFGSRLRLLLWAPLVMVVVVLVLAVTSRWPVPFRSRHHDDSIPEAGRVGIYSVMATIILPALLGGHALALSAAAGLVTPSRLTVLFALLLSLVLIATGNYFPRLTERNLFIGARFPWTFMNQETWRRTQRMAGYALVFVGLIGLVAVLVYPSRALVLVVLSAKTAFFTAAAYSLYVAYRTWWQRA